jgi:tetratricopeptide (TPR) repeat protein
MGDENVGSPPPGRRRLAAGIAIVLALGWTAVRFGAATVRGRAWEDFWQGRLRPALDGYRTAARLEPWSWDAREGEREVYSSGLERPSALASEAGLDPSEASRRIASLIAAQVRSAPLLPGTWAGVGEFYGALKPENQRHRVYRLEEISPDPAENLEPEDILQIRALEVASRIDPNGFYYRDTLGDLAWGLGLRELAQEAYREAVHLNPDTRSHLFLGGPRLDPGLAEVTVEAMTRSVLPPRSAHPETVFRQLGVLLISLEKYAEARASFERAEQNSHGKDYSLWQAHAAERQGLEEDAIRLYRRALARGRLDRDRRFRVYLRLGLLLERMGRHRDAADEIRSALMLKQRDPQGLLALARIYENLGLIPEAEEQYLRASEAGSDRVPGLVSLVSFYRRIGRPERALSPARKLRDLQPGEPIYQRQLEEIQKDIAGGYRVSPGL